MLLTLKYLLQLSDREIIRMYPRITSSQAFRIIVTLEEKVRVEQILNLLSENFLITYNLLILKNDEEERFSFIVEVPNPAALERFVKAGMTFDKIRLHWVYGVSSSDAEYECPNSGVKELGLQVTANLQKLNYLVTERVVKRYIKINSSSVFVTRMDGELLQQKFNLFWEEMLNFFQNALNVELACNKFALGCYDLSFKFVCMEEQKLLDSIKQLNELYKFKLILKGGKPNYCLLISGECATKIQAIVNSQAVQIVAQNTAGICAQLGISPGASISDNNNFNINSNPESGNAGMPPLCMNHVQPNVEPGNEATQGNVGFVPSTTTSFSLNM